MSGTEQDPILIEDVFFPSYVVALDEIEGMTAFQELASIVGVQPVLEAVQSLLHSPADPVNDEDTEMVDICNWLDLIDEIESTPCLIDLVDM